MSCTKQKKKKRQVKARNVDERREAAITLFFQTGSSLGRSIQQITGLMYDTDALPDRTPYIASPIGADD
jgi:hypothetical protein